MAILTVWQFPSADGAWEATRTLEGLQGGGLTSVQDELRYALAGHEPELLETDLSANLSEYEEAKLREVFAED
jgi:uncharacterized membrane protein